MQILPSEFFSYIKHYQFLESGEYCGNTGMAFLFNQGSIIANISSSFLYGHISHFQDRSLIEKASFIIIVFQPDGAYKLLGISARELRDQIISKQDLWTVNAKALRPSSAS